MPDRIWNAAEYTRLSRDDGDKAESNSITSQKEIIRDYVRQHPEFVIVKEYIERFEDVLPAEEGVTIPERRNA